AVGLIDLAHTLSFNGMPDFVTPASVEKAINFWLAARSIFALAILWVAFRPWRPLANPDSRYRLLAATLVLTAAVWWLGLFYPHRWPRTFIEGQGLTPFKIGAEYGIVVILCLAAVGLYGKMRQPFWQEKAERLFAAVVITVLSELAFTLYAAATDIFNLLGHLYKILAYGFVYRAVFVASVQEPFAQLRQARERYATLAALAPVGIFQTDAAGRCSYVNEYWLEMAGMSLAEAMGDGWARALHPEDRERIVAAWAKAARERAAFQDAYRFQRPDGRIFWLYGQARPEVDEQGQVAGYVGTVTDLSEHQRAQESLLESEARFRTIMDSLDALVYVADMASYELLFVNRYGRARWGNVIGKKCWQALQTGQTGPCAFCTNDRLLTAEGKPAGVYAWEFRNTVTGQWFDCRDQAIRWPDGRLVRLEIATDITERKAVDEELRSVREDWERIFAAIGDVATIQDPDHRIIRANRQAGEVLGIPAEELIGRFCYEVFHGGSEPCEGCPGLFTGRDMTTHRAEIVHERLGKTFALSAYPVRGPGGELVRIVYLARDITELKTLERQLRQAQKMEAIGTLAGGIAHDFNNILTPVLGYSEIIAESLPADNPMVEPAREVLKAGRRARDLVKQILTFSRQAEQERRPIEVRLVVKEALKLLRSTLPATIEIRQAIGPECGMVLADPTMIHQVMMNLCTNAYHAMKEKGGVLGVSLDEVAIGPGDYLTALQLMPGPYLRLTVSDTGCGMSPQILERIFEPYFTTKAPEEGTGLGLSVVHGIVTSLGGHITVYSELGQGTTFHVYLPCYREERQGEGAAAGGGPALPTGHEHVLVVDDEPTITELVQQMLEGLGYRVTSANDPRAALEWFAAQPGQFDLVLTDMAMPHMNGAELARQLLARRPGLPVILCTGFSEIINEEKAKTLGICRLLMKPVLRDELARVVREALDQPARG
ncbi:MAG: MASE3 domain-containing protein, partial [Thermodesulfobacteriota bacterium]